MSNRSVSYFDLDDARSASRRLTGDDQPRAVEAAMPVEQYTAFRADRFRPAAASTAPAGTPSAPPPAAPIAAPDSTVTTAPADDKPLPPAPDEGFTNWNDLLAWCRIASGARFVFVVDHEGFVLSQDGDCDDEDIEGIGSQLTVMIASADEMGSAGKPRRFVMEFDNYWLTAYRFADDSGELLLAAASTAPIGAQQSRGVLGVFQRSLMHI